MSDLDRAAWIPADVPDRSWDRAVNLAVDWIEQECRRQRTAAILVIAARDVTAYSATAAALARRYRPTTPRSRWAHRRGGGTGPVLAYAPTAEALDYAISLARRSSLAVIESRAYPLRGWARENGAVDLTHSESVQSDPLDDSLPGRDPRLAQALNTLVLCGTHGYAPPPDRHQAQAVLDGLAGDGLLDRHALLDALADRGIPPHGLAQLGVLANAAR